MLQNLLIHVASAGTDQGLVDVEVVNQVLCSVVTVLGSRQGIVVKLDSWGWAALLVVELKHLLLAVELDDQLAGLEAVSDRHVQIENHDIE